MTRFRLGEWTYMVESLSIALSNQGEGIDILSTKKHLWVLCFGILAEFTSFIVAAISLQKPRSQLFTLRQRPHIERARWTLGLHDLIPMMWNDWNTCGVYEIETCLKMFFFHSSIVLLCSYIKWGIPYFARFFTLVPPSGNCVSTTFQIHRIVSSENVLVQIWK